MTASTAVPAVLVADEGEREDRNRREKKNERTKGCEGKRRKEGLGLVAVDAAVWPPESSPSHGEGGE